MENNITRSAEQLGRDAAEYIDLKIDDVKLRTAKALSITLNRLILSVLFLSLGSIILAALAFGGVLLIGKLLGNYAAGAFIVAGFFLIVLIILVLLRKKLFLGGLVRMFMKLFFEN
ncbi:MAG: hypothetical protein ACI4TM_05175, partial [Candidatus Cryptobacteroides sp.]